LFQITSDFRVLIAGGGDVQAVPVAGAVSALVNTGAAW
jgi:hypothetical protein